MIIIIRRRRRMYIYSALIDALSAHIIHIKLNVIFYTHVEHSPIKSNLHKVCKHVFVATKVSLCLSRQKYALFCHDKHTSVPTKDMFCRDKTFVVTKIIRVAAPANNSIGQKGEGTAGLSGGVRGRSSLLFLSCP